MNLFFSYSHKDAGKVLEFCRLIEPYHQVWIDRDDIPAGSHWKREIWSGIARSHCVVFFVSQNSVNSKYCQIELEAAFRLNKLIIPMIIEEVSLPRQLAELQWIFLENQIEAASKLLGSLSSHPNWWKWAAVAELGVIGCLIFAALFL